MLALTASSGWEVGGREFACIHVSSLDMVESALQMVLQEWEGEAWAKEIDSGMAEYELWAKEIETNMYQDWADELTRVDC